MATSIYKRIIDQVVTDIQGLSLSGVTSSNIVAMKVSTNRKKEIASLPAVLVSPFGTPRTEIREAASTNVHDVIVYPVAVVTIQAGNADQTTNFDRFVLWHEQIRQKFINQVLSDGTGRVAYGCDYDGRDTFDASAWFKNLDAGGMVLRFKSQEARG